MSLKRLVIATAAALGLGAGPAAVLAASATHNVRAVAAHTAATATAVLPEDVAGGSLRAILRDGGNPPDVWGRSRACARMVRKNARIARRP